MRFGNPLLGVVRPLARVLALSLIVSASVAGPRSVRADPQALPLRADPLLPNVEAPLSLDELRGDMRRYFREEKRGGAVLMTMGAPGVALGGGLLAYDSEFGRGFAYPVLIIGALEMIGGLLFYARTNRQVQKLDEGLLHDTWATRNLELKRIRRVNLEFSLIQALEITLLVGGVGMAAAGAATRNPTLSGVGVGIGVESAGLLVFDLFAGKRALRWRSSLERFAQ